MDPIPTHIPPQTPILIYGPTASGKSELALRLAEQMGGVIVNADASQVFGNWQVVTARPGPDDLARAPHHLYGHLAADAAYSVGHWLREVAPLLDGEARPIIVGGTGLYLSALTEGLVDIPPTPPKIREEADKLRTSGELDAMIAALDDQTRARLDLANPMRVQRAWEVLRSTGRGLASWQDETGPALLPLNKAHAINVLSDKDWLNDRIAQRFEWMMDNGGLEEARDNLKDADSGHLSMRVIGAPELFAYLRGAMDRDTAIERATITTRQFAKRQRTWGRARMKSWQTWCADGRADG